MKALLTPGHLLLELFAKNAFLDIFSLKNAFCNIFRLFAFLNFFLHLSFSPCLIFCHCDWPSTVLSSSPKILREHHRVVTGNFALGFSVICWSIFMHISASTQGRSQKKLMTEAMSMKDLWPRQSVHGWVLFLGITALIILPWTPKICLECLLCCNQSHARSSHHRNHTHEPFPSGPVFLQANNYFSFPFVLQHVL